MAQEKDCGPRHCVAATSVRVVALGGPIVVVASSPADRIVDVWRLVSIAEAVRN